MKLLNKFIVYPKKIVANITKFKSHCNAKICAIVKADAYGHGIGGVVPYIKKYVDFFGVADEREAPKVRSLTAKPILVLNMVEIDNLPRLLTEQISLSVSNFAYLKQILKVANKLNIKAKIHLKINTGMNRLGVGSEKLFKQMLNFISSQDTLVLEGVYTHFHDSLNMKSTENQYQIFCEFLKQIDGKHKPIIHASATNAVLINPKYQFDMVRLGIAMYGYCDIPSQNFTPALQLESTITNIVSVKKGECVGYSNNFVANKKMKVACVSLGYADGFLRANSNNGKVIVNNSYASVVGNVCMDLFMIDVSHVKCKVGDRVIVIGESLDKKITAQDIAQNTNTISYEILTNLKRDRMQYVVSEK